MRVFTIFLPTIFLTTLFALCAALSAQAQPEPRVLATIKPLHSLVQSVLGDTARAELLLDNTASPHDFQMKPSQIRALHQADIVFYIDADFEQFLQRVLPDLPEATTQIPIAQRAEIALVPLRGGGDDKDDHDDDHDHGHDHAAQDYHVWLDPNNAVKMVQTIATSLAQIYPHNAAIYQANARTAIAALNALHSDVQARLAPVKDQPFIVFHDAYGYFERAYGLPTPAVIALDPTIPPSPKRIVQIRENLAQTGARCLFSEPQFSDKVLDVIRADSNARIAVLDPLGAELPSGAGLYTALLQGLAGALADCLDGS